MLFVHFLFIHVYLEKHSFSDQINNEMIKGEDDMMHLQLAEVLKQLWSCLYRASSILFKVKFFWRISRGAVMIPMVALIFLVFLVSLVEAGYLAL